MKVAPSDSQIILQVVRGERPWTDLGAVGIAITLQDDSCVVDNPRHVSSVPKVADVAQGLITYLDDSKKLQVWAWVLLSGSTFLDLSSLHDRPKGDVILDALWDATFVKAISDEAIRVAREILKSS